ncbi:putative cytochrome P450 oxidoreductase [Glonium stellatum]|uniref:Putative cytochrome P450 oxidoreductase n=1 Tax=Glonium stellatum TaxID=574774 RepID=A0A8E2EQV0_9PEZI|nr:putative cytochrome P450 oxidoreductase [Glonium stellatum]
MPRASVSVIAGLLALYLFYHIFQTYRGLRDIPGPFWAKFTNLQRIYWVRTMRAHEIHQKAHEKYGDCVRFGPHMVSISDPAVIPILYPMRTGFPKSKFYRAFIPYTKGGSLPAVFTTQDEQLHKQLKIPIAPLYSLSNVVTFESFVDEVLQVLCHQLDKRFVESQATFDLGNWLQYFAFDLMGTMTFSKRYGLLETGTDINGMLGAIWEFMLTIAPMTQIPWLDKLWYKSPLTTLLKKQIASPILKIVSDSINERQHETKDTVESQKGNSTSNRDFLSYFLETQATNSSIPSWSVKAWTFSNVIAGSDSTAVVMRTVMYNLLAHQDSFNRVYEELINAEKMTGLTRPFPKWSEVKDLPYLDACVNEAIRLHPPFCLPLERVVPKGGVEICGRRFTEGTVIGMNPYVANRHRPTFGEDADLWNPERWLGKDVAHRRKLEGSIMTFGAGRRICMGKYVALLEIKKIVPALLLNYEIQLLDARSYSVENSYFFRQTGIDVKIKRRLMAA